MTTNNTTFNSTITLSNEDIARLNNSKCYKLDPSNQILTPKNKAVYEAFSTYGTAEYRFFQLLKADMPNLTISYTPTRRNIKARSNSKITYDRMVKYISCQPNSTLLLKVFANVRELSKSQPSSYNFVFDWFKDTFPHYNELPQFDDNGDLIPQYDLAAIIKSNPEAQTAETAQGKITLEEELPDAA